MLDLQPPLFESPQMPRRFALAGAERFQAPTALANSSARALKHGEVLVLRPPHRRSFLLHGQARATANNFAVSSRSPFLAHGALSGGRLDRSSFPGRQPQRNAPADQREQGS